MEYKIKIGKWGSIFAVPTAVVDDYIKLASGQAVKVLLYFLRIGECSSEQAASALGMEEESVADALSFWEQIGLFSETENTSVKKQEKMEEDIIPAESAKEIPKAGHSPKRSVSPKEIAERLNSSDEIKFLFNTAENALGHLLTNTEQNSLLWIHDYLGMKTDIIAMLFEYCKVYGKMSMQYIERSAASWQEKEIFTHEQAEAEIQTAKRRLELSNKVKNAFGIERQLTTKEKEYVSEWTNLGYDIDLIKYSYDKTIDSIGKISFAYINKILSDWYSKGLTSRILIDGSDSERPKYNQEKRSNKKENTYYEDDPFESLAVNIKRYNEKYKGEK